MMGVQVGHLCHGTWPSPQTLLLVLGDAGRSVVAQQPGRCMSFLVLRPEASTIVPANCF